MANKAVYTALFGNYDDFNDPHYVTPGWDHIIYTDQDIKSDVWEVRKISVEGDPQRMARKVKIKFYEFIEHDMSLWLDCSFDIRTDLNKFWDERFVEPFSVPNHPIRSCVYREIESCIVNQRGDEAELIKQREAYKEAGVPNWGGIITSGVMMRRKCDFMMDFCDAWWEELSLFSVRDQVAFAKVAWDWKWKYHTYKWDYSQSKELKYRKHNKYK